MSAKACKIVKMRRLADKSEMSVLDLFCGVGGFSLGATRAGFKLVGSIDWDKDAIKMHKINFPNSPHWRTDITKIDGDDIRVKFDITHLAGIIGGPPCQGFSRMGHQRVDDVRNDLFVKFFSLVKELQPKFFLAENVQGLLDAKNKPLVEKALNLVRRGYVVLDPLVLKASEHGVPTTRTRVFFFGYKKDIGVTISADAILEGMQRSATITVADAFEGLPDKIREKIGKSNMNGWRKLSKTNRHRGFYFDRLSGHVPNGVGDATSIMRLKKKGEVSGNQGTIHDLKVKKRWHGLAQGKQDKISKARRLELNGFCHTIRAGTGRDMGSFQSLRPIHPVLDRVITPREAARLQSFPDWFQFDHTKWQSFRQIGNSVCPILAEKILASIKKRMEVSNG